MLKTRRSCKKILEQRLTPGRLRHSLLVEEMAIRLASLHGADWYEAGLAGLLHDICRDDDIQWQMEYMSRAGLRLDKAWMQNPQIWHAPCGSLFLRKELGLRNRGILRAVRYHTTGRRGMSLLEKVVFVADAVSADRTWEGVETLRRTAMTDLDSAMVQCLRDAVARVAQSGLPLVRETWEAYNNLTRYSKQSFETGTREH